MNRNKEYQLAMELFHQKNDLLILQKTYYKEHKLHKKNR